MEVNLALLQGRLGYQTGGLPVIYDKAPPEKPVDRRRRPHTWREAPREERVIRDPAPRRVPVEGDTIAEVDFDEAEYRGDGEGGVYYQAEEEGYNRWFVSGVVDSGEFVEDLFTDDGPYWTEEEALEAGENAALEWCIENSVDWRDDDSEER